MSSSNSNGNISSTYGYVILDSGAVIRNNGSVALSKLLSSGEKCFTTPTVMAEIRDAKSRAVLDQALSLVTNASTSSASASALEVRIPSAESVAAVCAFARKTGDYRSLSGTDMEVLALQYELDVFGCGGSTTHLRLDKFDKKTHEELLQESEVVQDDGTVTVVGEDEDAENNDEHEENRNANSGSICTEEIVTAKENSAPKSWASQIGGSITVDVDSNVEVDVLPTGIFGKMKLMGHSNDETTMSNTYLGGQFDDVEEEDCYDQKGPLSEECRDDTGVVIDEATSLANELEQDFPSLVAAATVLYDGSDNEESSELVASKEAELERRKQEALKPKLTKDGRHYNSFASSKYKHLLSSNGTAKNMKDIGDLEHERELKKLSFIQDFQANDELDEMDPEWKSKSRIMNGSEVIGQSNEVDDDGEGWVNVTNFRPGEASLGFGLSSKKEKKGKSTKDGDKKSDGPSDVCRAACATTDFAMQNVILQMGMKLITVDGMAVRKLKQWVTRCGACFTVFPNDSSNQSSRLFCSRCGSDMLQRVAASVDGKTGRYILHLSKKRQKKVNLRGTKFSLPKPGKGNRFEGDLLLREDQLMMGAWNQKVKKGNKEVQSIFGSDITMGIGLDVTKRDDVKVGFGRRNPNSSKFGRERRGKKKKNPTQKACGLRRNF